MTNQLKQLSEVATQGEWTGHNMVHEENRPMTPDELGEYVTNAVKLSPETRFLFVSGKSEQDGEDVDICHVGNGPKGPQNTAFICALVNAYRAGELIPASELDCWKQVRDAVATFEGQGESWPKHGNAPLAVTASYAMKRSRIKELEAQLTEAHAREAVAYEVVEAISAYETAETAAADTGSEDDYWFVFECWDAVQTKKAAFLDATDPAHTTTALEQIRQQARDEEREAMNHVAETLKEAVHSYNQWMLDDDYNAGPVLDRTISHIKSALATLSADTQENSDE
jgi:hypothetical protein